MSGPTWTHEQFEQRQAEIIAAGELMLGPSLAEQFAALPAEAQLEAFELLTPIEWLRLEHDWRFWGREKQLVALGPTSAAAKNPHVCQLGTGDYDVALWLAGRGFGKSRTGSETVVDRILRGLAKSICIIGPDWRDVRRNMIGGLPDTDSGLLDVMPPWIPANSREGYIHDKVKNEIYLPSIDTTIYLNTGESKEQRGGNFDTIWIDEPIKFRYLDEVLQNLDMALRRVTSVPQMLITTTPKNQAWLREMIMQDSTMSIHGITDENASNVARRFLARLKKKYGGTRLGDQECGARILGDNDEAIARQSDIDAGRVRSAPELDEVGVGVDPAVSEKRKSDDSGIVVDARVGDRLYVLEDASGRYSADVEKGSKGWPAKVAELAKTYGAKFVIAERNKIGDAGKVLIRQALAEVGLRDKVEIREAYSFKDKWTRATTTVSPLYDQQRVHHVGRFSTLENYLTQWDPSSGVSPGALDAHVHVAVELLGLANLEPKVDPRAAFKGFVEQNATGWAVPERTI